MYMYMCRNFSPGSRRVVLLAGRSIDWRPNAIGRLRPAIHYMS